MKITGKDVLDASYSPQRVPARTWDVLSEVSHARLTGIADALNESHITPLQGEIEQSKDLFHTFMAGANDLFLERKQQVADLKALVQDFVNLLEDENLLIEDCLDEWGVKRDETLTTAKALLNEENDTCKL